MTAAPERDRRVWWVALGYTGLAVFYTWPLTAGLARDVPGDLGDSLLNMWILAWGAEHLPRVLAGVETWSSFWNAGIFHPEPHALALSEHMAAQALQVAPIYALTGNIILCYNVVFLSTFVLSALGAYLLARDLTGDWRAGVVAGLVFGFLPYRISQVPHVQILSAQWMPFALWGVHRYVARGSTRALAGGSVALVAQNLSCGYYLLYFAPFVPLFAVQQLHAAGRRRDVRAWLGLAVAGAGTVAVTVPFLLPYLEVQRLYAFERPFGEVLTFSANVWSYATAAEPIHLWGRLLRLHPHGEGETFLGTAAFVLAAAALADAWRLARADAAGVPTARDWRRTAAVVVAVFLAVQMAGLLATLLVGGFHVTIGGLPIRASTPARLLAQAALALAAWLALSARARATLRRVAAAPAVAYAALMLLAMWLSLGPEPSAGPSRVSGIGLYGLLYEYVPGFTGVRVPARYAMVAGLFLSVIAAVGAARWLRQPRRLAAVALLSVLVLADGAATPLAMNHTWGTNEATPPGRVHPAAEAPYVYRRVRALPADAAVAEFPFGDPAWEIRYVYYAAAHGRRILNGYSGAFPPAYQRRVAALRRFDADGETAWRALLDAGTTHVVVHAQAFADPATAGALEAWLASRGARLLDRFDAGETVWALER